MCPWTEIANLDKNYFLAVLAHHHMLLLLMMMMMMTTYSRFHFDFLEIGVVHETSSTNGEQSKLTINQFFPDKFPEPGSKH